MTEQHFPIEELLKRLKLEPEAVKALLAELIAEYTKEYLTIDEVAKRLSWEKKTVKNKMEAGIFQKGIHYFNPKGIPTEVQVVGHCRMAGGKGRPGWRSGG